MSPDRHPRGADGRLLPRRGGRSGRWEVRSWERTTTRTRSPGTRAAGRARRTNRCLRNHRGRGPLRRPNVRRPPVSGGARSSSGCSQPAAKRQCSGRSRVRPGPGRRARRIEEAAEAATEAAAEAEAEAAKGTAAATEDGSVTSQKMEMSKPTQARRRRLPVGYLREAAGTHARRLCRDLQGRPLLRCPLP